MIVHMMQNMDLPVSPEQWPTVTEYLIKGFPEKPKPAAVVVPGPVEAAITEWPVPIGVKTTRSVRLDRTAQSGTRDKLRTSLEPAGTRFRLRSRHAKRARHNCCSTLWRPS
jgi:hypothetical protein